MSEKPTRRTVIQRVLGGFAGAVLSKPGLAIEGIAAGAAASELFRRQDAASELSLAKTPELPTALLPVASFMGRGYEDPRKPAFFITSKDGQLVKVHENLYQIRANTPIPFIGYENTQTMDISGLPYKPQAIEPQPVLSPTGNRTVFPGELKIPGMENVSAPWQLVSLTRDDNNKAYARLESADLGGKLSWGMGKRGEIYVAREGLYQGIDLPASPINIFVRPDKLSQFVIPLLLQQERILGESTRNSVGDQFRVTLERTKKDQRVGISLGKGRVMQLPEIIDITPQEHLDILEEDEYHKTARGTFLVHGSIQTDNLPPEYQHLADSLRVPYQLTSQKAQQYNIPSLIIVRYGAEYGMMGIGNVATTDTVVLTAADLMTLQLPNSEIPSTDERYKLVAGLTLPEEPTGTVTLQMGKSMFPAVNLEQLGALAFKKQDNLPSLLPRQLI